MPLSETQIIAHFKCVAKKKDYCQYCTEQLRTFKWVDKQGGIHTYGTDVYIQWSLDSNYRRVYAGGQAKPLNDFTTVQQLATFINDNHTI